MVSPEPGAAAPSRLLDAVALARHHRRLLRAATPPWLHGEVARRMAERLPVIRQQPQQVADWGARLGASSGLLNKAYPKARVHAVANGRVEPQPASWWQRWLPAAAPAAVGESEVPPGLAQLVWANMALHWSADPQALMRQWQRALAVDGFLMFSTLGPGSLFGLRELYAQAQWPPPFAPFVDMHDLGDMLVRAGFADPVMDQETLTLHWATPQALLAELRTLGANADAKRHAGLRTPRWRDRLCAALQASGVRPKLTFEIIYGHALRAEHGVPLRGQTVIALDELRAMVGARGPRRSR